VSPTIKCPRCGHADTFIKGYLPDTCICRMCQSQLDWREIPGMGPECRPLEPAGSEPDGDDGGTGSAESPGAAHPGESRA
jgi:hypothetical protein